MDCLKSTGETIHKRGRSSCRESGQINKTHQEMYCGLDSDCVGGVVRSSCYIEASDSGSPVYYKSGSSLYLVNIGTARAGDGSHDTMGSSTNSMHQNQNFWFGGDPYSGSC